MPKLTSDTIRRYVGDTSFQRSQDYFADEMVINGRRVGDTIKADCHGSRGTPYRVSATVTDGQIVEAGCSCPVGGACKHIAAMLLTWLDRPDDFVAVEETHTALEKRSKAELIALVEQMLLREPELESLLEMPLPTGEKKQPVNPKAYQRQAAAAFNVREYEWGMEDDIARQLDATLDIGHKFLKQGDPYNAAAVYQAVSDEVLEHYEEFQDESGELGGVVNDCVTGLGECLAQIQDDDQWRENILHALFDAYRSDVEIGGVGLGDEAPDIIVKHATPDEKKQVVKWVREAMKSQKGDEWSHNYHRQVYGGFLLDLQADTLDNEAFIKLCRETHRLNDLVDRLLALKRLDEATTEAKQASDYELLQMADVFVQHNQADLIERLMTERLPRTHDSRLMEWLKRRLAERGDATGAMTLARKLFAERGSLEPYKELHKLADQLKNWPTVRAEILAELERKKDWSLLTHIHLDEKDIDAALQTVKQIKREYGYGSYAWGEDLAVTVAQAAESSHPREALGIYVQKVEQFIGVRNRSAYQQACQYLLKARKLYQQLGEEAAWQQYLTRLQEQYKTLRALHDEMQKAKVK